MSWWSRPTVVFGLHRMIRCVLVDSRIVRAQLLAYIPPPTQTPFSGLRRLDGCAPAFSAGSATRNCAGFALPQHPIASLVVARISKLLPLQVLESFQGATTVAWAAAAVIIRRDRQHMFVPPLRSARFWSVPAAGDVLDCFQIGHPVHGIRFEITAFGPFVPSIDGHDLIGNGSPR